MDYKKNRKYFSPKGGAGKFVFLFILILATIVLFKMNQTMYGQYGIGAVVLTIVVMVLTRRPSDAYIDGVVAEELKKLEAAALKKLGLDKEEISVAPAIRVCAYERVGWKWIDGDKYGTAIPILGKDEKMRYPAVTMHYFCFSEHEINYYSRTYSLVCDHISETTNVINYNDVTSIRSSSVAYPVWDKKAGKEDPEKRGKQDAFAVNVPGDSIVCATERLNEADECVNALRALVKQKKNA